LTAVRNFVITFFLSILIFGLIAYGLVQFTTAAFELGAEKTPGGETGGEDTAPPSDTEDINDPQDWIDIKGDSFTALLIGSNYQPDVYQDYDVKDENATNDGFPLEPREVETETIILLRVNKETGECLFCPIPAIMRITVDGLTCQLKDLYAMKGADALRSKVMAITGIPIDYHVMVTMANLAALIDELGGVTYFVETDMYYVDENIGLEIDLRRGSQKLNGEKAVKMLRYCAYDDGATSRRKCAVSFLKELLKVAMSKVKMEDAALSYANYAKYFETNFTIGDLGDQVDLIFSYNKMTIRDYTYPGTTVGEGDDAYFSANIAKAIEFFSQYKYKG